MKLLVAATAVVLSVVACGRAKVPPAVVRLDAPPEASTTATLGSPAPGAAHVDAVERAGAPLGLLMILDAGTPLPLGDLDVPDIDSFVVPDGGLALTGITPTAGRVDGGSR